MNGITIINEYVCSEFSVGECVFAGFMVVFLIFWAWWSPKYFVPRSKIKDRLIFGITLTILSIALAACFTYVAYEEYMNPWKEYDVVVSDEASYNEFINRYDVINVDGNVLRVIDK